MTAHRISYVYSRRLAIGAGLDLEKHEADRTLPSKLKCHRLADPISLVAS